MKPKIALVLSGGAALGFAHVGVIDVLMQNNINIDIVTGSSMGAVVGGALAKGLTAKEMIMFAKKMNAWKFLGVNFKPNGLLSGNNITRLLLGVYGDVKIEDLQKKFSCVAVDIVTHKEKHFFEGSLLDAVRSSMNIPGIFVPYEYNENHYVDGGITNYFPDDVAKKMGADIIIGVDVIKHGTKKQLPTTLMASVFASFNLANLAVRNARKNNCDVIIEPHQEDEVSQMGFNQKEIMRSIQIGREEAQKMMPQIIEVINNWSKKKK